MIHLQPDLERATLILQGLGQVINLMEFYFHIRKKNN